eukprot:366334-Chlamydomonas_euryale.AAC.3
MRAAVHTQTTRLSACVRHDVSPGAPHCACTRVRWRSLTRHAPVPPTSSSVGFWADAAKLLVRCIPPSSGVGRGRSE